MDKLAILSFPRSATKLLAKYYEHKGYHRYGEFFDVFSNDIILDKKPYAIRKSIVNQQIIHTNRNNNIQYINYLMHKETENRLEIFNKYQHNNSIITVWLENFEMCPQLIIALKDFHFLCIQRKNIFEQLLSRCIVHYNLNFDNEIESKPIIVEGKIFKHFYYSLKKLYSLQNYFVSTGNGTYLDFDDIINNNYVFPTKDEHKNCNEFILNIDYIKKLYKEIHTDDSNI